MADDDQISICTRISRMRDELRLWGEALCPGCLDERVEPEAHLLWTGHLKEVNPVLAVVDLEDV